MTGIDGIRTENELRIAVKKSNNTSESILFSRRGIFKKEVELDRQWMQGNEVQKKKTQQKQSKSIR